MADDLYVRLQKALDEAEVDVQDMGHVWRFGDQICGKAALKLIERDRMLLAALEETEKALLDEVPGTVKMLRHHRMITLETEAKRLVWLTDTETTDR